MAKEEENTMSKKNKHVVITGHVIETAPDGRLHVQFAANGSKFFHMWFSPTQVQYVNETKKLDVDRWMKWLWVRLDSVATHDHIAEIAEELAFEVQGYSDDDAYYIALSTALFMEANNALAKFGDEHKNSLGALREAVAAFEVFLTSDEEKPSKVYDADFARATIKRWGERYAKASGDTWLGTITAEMGHELARMLCEARMSGRADLQELLESAKRTQEAIQSGKTYPPVFSDTNKAGVCDCYDDGVGPRIGPNCTNECHGTTGKPCKCSPKLETSHASIGAGGGDEDGYVHPDVLAEQSPEFQAEYKQRANAVRPDTYLSDCIETDWSLAIEAFGKIVAMTEDDSPVNRIAVEAVTALRYWQRRDGERCPSDVWCGDCRHAKNIHDESGCSAIDDGDECSCQGFVAPRTKEAFPCVGCGSPGSKHYYPCPAVEEMPRTNEPLVGSHAMDYRLARHIAGAKSEESLSEAVKRLREHRTEPAVPERHGIRMNCACEACREIRRDMADANRYRAQQEPARSERLEAMGFESLDARAYTVGDAIGLQRRESPPPEPSAAQETADTICHEVRALAVSLDYWRNEVKRVDAELHILRKVAEAARVVFAEEWGPTTARHIQEYGPVHWVALTNALSALSSSNTNEGATDK